MVLLSAEPSEGRSYFSQAPWGPAFVPDPSSDLSGPRDLVVRLPHARSVAISMSGMKSRGPGLDDYLDQGVPVLLEGEPIARARATPRRTRFFVKPGTIRIEGEPSAVVTPGLRVRGGWFPQRMTLRDDEGRLVWSPPSGVVNLRTGPLLLVAPKVSDRASPEHVALWLASWLMFETAY